MLVREGFNVMLLVVVRMVKIMSVGMSGRSVFSWMEVMMFCMSLLIVLSRSSKVKYLSIVIEVMWVGEVVRMDV